MDGNVWSLGGSPMTPTGRASEAPPLQPDAGETLPRHDVRALMAGGNRALMMLDGTAYTLRITRAGKLILTK